MYIRLYICSLLETDRYMLTFTELTSIYPNFEGLHHYIENTAAGDREQRTENKSFSV